MTCSARKHSFNQKGGCNIETKHTAQGTKKLVSDSPGLVDFTLTCPNGKWKFWGKLFLRKFGQAGRLNYIAPCGRTCVKLNVAIKCTYNNFSCRLLMRYQTPCGLLHFFLPYSLYFLHSSSLLFFSHCLQFS